MQHLHTNPTHLISQHTSYSILSLSMNETLFFHDTSSTPSTDQIEIVLFIVLRERIPLSLQTTEDAELISERVYIEEIDFQKRQLTLCRINDASLTRYCYIKDASSLAAPRLLLCLV